MPFLVENKEKIKLHLATGLAKNDEAYYEYLKGKFKKWQEGQHKKNFERNYILSLIYLNKSEWLFAGIYSSLGVEKLEDDSYMYETELSDIGEELIGKLVINYNRTDRQSYRYLENCIDELTVCEIKREKYTVSPFPGFNNVFIEFDLLKIIFQEQENTWKSILEKVKGVYLISDKSNGKLYVGSAYGGDAIWQRWNNYIENGHGNNKSLREKIQKNGYEYASNFNFSILEIFGLNVTDSEIIDKESFWKEKLMTREYGYNKN